MQRRDDSFAIGANKLALVAPHVMHMHLVKTEIEERLDVLAMLVQVGRDEDAPLEILRAYHLSEGGEIFGRANVLFGRFDAAVGPLLHRLFHALLICRTPRDVQLQQFRHGGRVLACLARALLEVFDQHFELIVRRGGSNQAINQSPGSLSSFRAGSRNIDGTGVFRAGIQARTLHLDVLTSVARLFAGKELFDDLDGLHHAFKAHRRVGPFSAHDMLVEGLARADAQPEATGIHSSQRRGGLRDDGRVIAIRGAGDARAEAHTLRREAERAHPGPYLRALPLLRYPGMKVVGSHYAPEPRLFSFLAPANQLRRPKLFQGRRITKYWHRYAPLIKILSYFDRS